MVDIVTVVVIVTVTAPSCALTHGEADTGHSL